jgi:hypothetical protein
VFKVRGAELQRGGVEWNAGWDGNASTDVEDDADNAGMVVECLTAEGAEGGNGMVVGMRPQMSQMSQIMPGMMVGMMVEKLNREDAEAQWNAWGGGRNSSTDVADDADNAWDDGRT